MKTGFELLDDAFLNKGTAFTESERKKLGLEGLLPPCVEDIETQAQRIYRQMERKTSGQRHSERRAFSGSCNVVLRGCDLSRHVRFHTGNPVQESLEPDHVPCAGIPRRVRIFISCIPDLHSNSHPD